MKKWANQTLNPPAKTVWVWEIENWRKDNYFEMVSVQHREPEYFNSFSGICDLSVLH